MSKPRWGAFVAIALATILTSGPGVAASASIAIDSVGGRRVVDGVVQGAVKGKVLVQGTAVTSAAAPDPVVQRPLVADAGDSAYVNSGTTATAGTATLLGAGFGGSAPYTFAWSAEAGQLTGADSATAQVKAVGVAAGTYTATLTITDATGATATDSVRYVVYATTPGQVIFDQTQADTTPGTNLGAEGGLTFKFDVPGTTVHSMRVRMTFGQQNDYDMRILDPSGIQRGSSGNGATNLVLGSEEFTIPMPAGGTWTVIADKYLTVPPDSVRVQVIAETRPADPRPVVSSGGPYRFAPGTPQAFSGSVSGGSAPIAAGWDTDENGLLDRSGTAFSGSFGLGRRLITLKATDASGLERRETTSVFVADQARLAQETTPLTVVAINDSGINAYHLEFSAQTYPDPEVLALTANFTKHPSEYIPGYPRDAQSIPITVGRGYFPLEDTRGADANGDGVLDGSIWDLKSASAPWGLEFGKLYWIPGTKIIGATQPGVLSCSNCAAGLNHVILDDDGHGSGSASVSVGNRYGYCPTCLLFVEKGLTPAPAANYPWVDISSNSYGCLANLPLCSSFTGVTRPAVERGQTILFAAGNGNANAFESVSPTYGSGTAGPDWNIIVGAIRRDVQRAIIGEGTPAHLSSWGDGNLPSACRSGVVSQCAFSGTSAATPYTAGIFGNVLTQVRRSIGDTSIGQRPGQVVAEGWPVAGSPYLSDGKLTRPELREAVLKTAFPLNQDNAQNIPVFPFPWTAPYNGDINVLFEGYGAATPNSARRAIDVLLGKMPLPVRAAEDRWFAIDASIRDTLWGNYDRDGDGDRDPAPHAGQFTLTLDQVQTVDSQMVAIATVSYILASASLGAAAASSAEGTANAYTYWLHRSSEGEPQVADGCGNAVTYMDQLDSSGDIEPCFTNRATSALAAYRPLGIWPTSSDTTYALPAGSSVTVELWIASDQVTVARPTGVLMAGDRVLGEGAGTPTPLIGSGPWISQGFPVVPPQPIPAGVTIDQNKCRDLGEFCWNKMLWSFETTRHAMPGEQLTFQVQLIGVRAWTFGYEAAHRSKITITPAAVPAGELDLAAAIAEPADGAKLPDQTTFNATGFATFPKLGTTEAGDHPTLKRVWVSVDDATFASPVEATLTLNAEETSGTWTAPMPGLTPGAHTLYAKACIDHSCSAVVQRAITVEDINTTPRVQWQVVPAGSSPSAAGWRAASGVLFWSFEFDTKAYGKGDFVIHTRLLEGGLQTAATSVGAKFR